MAAPLTAFPAVDLPSTSPVPPVSDTPVIPRASLASLPSLPYLPPLPPLPESAAPSAAPVRTGRHARRAAEELPAWQRDALALWRTANFRGIVDAVGGIGRTRLGLAAVAQAHADGLDSLVLVPDTATQQHWLAELVAHLPHLRIGALGGGLTAHFGDCDVVVALARTAARKRLLPSLRRGLLVADECHRYATATFSPALDPAFERRLGLSAHYEREDGAHTVHLQPYFGSRIFHLGYDRALREGTVAPLALALVGVELTPSERSTYDRSHRQVTEAVRTLGELGVTVTDPGVGAVPSVIRELTSWDDGTRTFHAARRLLIHHARRRALLAEATAKYTALGRLSPVLRTARAGVVYTQSADAAAAAAEICAAHDLLVSAVHSGAEREQRRSDSDPAGPHHLELVTDDTPPPAAGSDLAIFLCANRGRRQLLQRIDRLVGLQRDRTARMVVARMVVLYAKDTVDDPAIAGDEHLRAVLPFATPFGLFADGDLDAVTRFLAPVPADEPAAPTYAGRHAVLDQNPHGETARVVPIRSRLADVLEVV